MSKWVSMWPNPGKTVHFLDIQFQIGINIAKNPYKTLRSLDFSPNLASIWPRPKQVEIGIKGIKEIKVVERGI